MGWTQLQMSDHLAFLIEKLPVLLFGFPGQRPGGLLLSLILAVLAAAVGFCLAVPVSSGRTFELASVALVRHRLCGGIPGFAVSPAAGARASGSGRGALRPELESAHVGPGGVSPLYQRLSGGNSAGRTGHCAPGTGGVGPAHGQPPLPGIPADQNALRAAGYAASLHPARPSVCSKTPPSSW